MNDGYMYIHISIILVLITVMISIFIYGIGLFIRHKWPNLNSQMGLFYFLIAVVWLGLVFLMTH